MKLGKEGFESWPLNWKQISTCLVEVNLNLAGIGSCTGESALVSSSGFTKCFSINSKTLVNLLVTNHDLANYCN